MAGFIALIALIGPALIYVGRLGGHVTRNKDDIQKIFGKLDYIYEWVKNGGKK